MNKSKKSKGERNPHEMSHTNGFAKIDAALDRVWKKMTAKIPENVLTSIILLVFGAVLLGVFVLPQRIEEYQCNQFAKPLFYHLIPEDSYAVQTSALRDEEGGTTAAIILGVASEMTAEELNAFYSDTEYVPANEGETVSLSVTALDESSISALQQAGMYREGDQYYFIYLYSKPQ